MKLSRRLGRLIPSSVRMLVRSKSPSVSTESKLPEAGQAKHPAPSPPKSAPPKLASPPLAEIPPANRKQVMRWITHSRWFMVDQLERTQPLPPKLKCRVCLTENPTHEHKVVESYCRFGGGRLIRYECPKCETIFGPMKVMNLTEPELAEEYRLLYEMYSEHDTSANEIRTFHTMNPTKTGVYLNFGAGGAWNSAISQLRKEGYNVYGFEPYAANAESHVIRDVEQLRSMRFDGIMSNNVLEHLTDPAETFTLWHQLLRDDSSVMAHSTPCYDYLYPFTRFHLFFFTGRAIDCLCERTGFEGARHTEDGEFICYRFTRKAVSRVQAA